ncbi:MAG: ATP-binding cassette domain-containing protein [Candidatus Dormibacteria bacterium]
MTGDRFATKPAVDGVEMESHPASVGGRSYAAVDVCHRYAPGTPLVLDHVNVTLERGGIHGVLGHNGAGKSTLLGVMAGRIHPSSGSLELDGERVAHRSPREALAQGVVAVYQELSVIPTLTVAENVLVGRQDRGKYRRSLGRRQRFLQQVVERSGLPRKSLDERVGGLSFGDRQRVEIARALMRDSAYLLLDEPTAGLAEEEVEQLFATLRAMVRGDPPVGVLMVNHHMDQILELCGTLTVLRDGVVVLSGKTGSWNKERLAAAVVGGDGAATATAGGSGDGRKGHYARDYPTSGSSQIGLAGVGSGGLRVTMVRARGVSCDNLTVPAGVVHGFYGLEGAGQERLLEVLAGAVRSEARVAALNGRPLGRGGPAEARRRGVLFLSGDRARMLVPQLSVVDNTILPCVAIQGARALLIARKKLEKSAREALAAMDVRGDWQAPVQSLSGGNQQRTVIARALVADYKVLLLVEPTVGIDLGARARIMNEVRLIADDRRIPVLIASTDENDLRGMCDVITIFREGRMVTTLDVAASTSREVLRALALGLEGAPYGDGQEARNSNEEES